MSKSLPHLSQYFSDHHRACDEAWADVETAASKKDLTAARAAWKRFADMTRLHFRWEEDVIFPALDDATGMRGVGPTAVMRHEHRQIRGLLDQLQAAADAGDLSALLDHGDTLLMLIQQHNAKEEGILYPMADRALDASWPVLAEQLEKAGS
ncbi:hemerythrin domain-containing protein [Myxococcota bacterium]|nr:hemerythrin domain-containing protein [Myxococcota bacterium]